jgi:hypothetical protein
MPVNVEAVYQDKAIDPVRFYRIRLMLEISIKRVNATGKERC